MVKASSEAVILCRDRGQVLCTQLLICNRIYHFICDSAPPMRVSGSASDRCALRVAPYKCIDKIQYNTINQDASILYLFGL